MLQDLRFAIRRVLNARGFSLSVVLILGIGVAAAATMASVLNALAFKQLSLPEPDTLVSVMSTDKAGLARGVPVAAVDRVRAANLVTSGWCGYSSALDATESGGRVVEIFGEVMTGDCEQVIGLVPALGRWFTPDEAPATGSSKPVMVITDSYWAAMFDRRADVLGATVKIADANVTVIGVMPPAYDGFSADTSTGFILPFNAHRPMANARLLTRLPEGTSASGLQSQLKTLWPSLLEAVMPAGPDRAQTIADAGVLVEPIAGGFSTLRRLYTAPLQRMAALAGTLLLLVCINVGGLLVSRVIARSHEFATMRAIGASTHRVVRPLALEGVLYSAAGAAVGVPLAYLASAAFLTLMPTSNVPWNIRLTPDPMVIAGIIVTAMTAALVIAALPIWLATRTRAALGTTRTASQTSSGWARGLLIAQVAVTVVLVFSAGLIVRSFNTLRSIDRGYDSERLLSLRLAANPGGYRGMDAGAYYRSLIDRALAVPGVESAGLARYFGTLNASTFDAPVGLAGSAENLSAGMIEYVSPGFFATAGVPLQSGRDIQWTDSAATAKVAVISESLARAIAPDGNVLGRVIRHGTTPATAQLQVVGVVGNLSMGNVRNTEPKMVYLSSTQFAQTTFATLHIRTTGEPLQFASAATQAVTSLGREHVLSVHARDILFTNSMVAERMGSTVSGAAATMALIVSCIGLFALLSHAVQRRTREIGIRVAVGASPRRVSAMVIREGLLLVIGGITLGIPVAFAGARLVQSLLYGVTATDVTTMVASAGLLLLAGLAATIRPTLRAVRVDPAVALRTE